MSFQSPIFAHVNHINNATLVCLDSSNIDNLKSRQTEVKATTSATIFTEIDISFGGLTKLLSTAILYNHNSIEDVGSTWQIQGYDGIDPDISNVVADSTTLPATTVYLVSEKIPSIEPTQSMFSFTTNVNNRLEPADIPVLSVRITLETSSPLEWRIGYLVLSPAYVLSTEADIGTPDARNSVTKGSAIQSHGGGVSEISAVTIPNTSISFPYLLAEDAQTLNTLSSLVNNSLPFVLHRYPAATVARDRLAEGGLVRFVKPNLVIPALDVNLNSLEDAYTLNDTIITPWR